jgi:hypothetical protein
MEKLVKLRDPFKISSGIQERAQTAKMDPNNGNFRRRPGASPDGESLQDVVSAVVKFNTQEGEIAH